MKIAKEYQASINQEQFWILNKIQPNNSTYNIPSLFRIKGDLDVDLLNRSITYVVNRHEALRSTFELKDEKLKQVVQDSVEIVLEFTDLSVSNDVANEKVIWNQINALIHEQFDLSTGPVIKTKLFKTAASRFFLLFVIHHIATDLHSNEIIFNELSKFYCNQVEQKNELKQYVDYSIWQQQYLNSKRFQSSLAFWRGQLAEKDRFLNFPIDKPRPVIQKHQGRTEPVFFSTSIMDKVRQYAKENSTTLFLITLTTYLILLYRYTNQKKMVIGVPFSNRLNAEIKDIVGCFVNILPLCISVDPEDKFVDVLTKVRKAMLLGHRNQDVQFETIVKELKPRRDPSYNTFFQTGFTFEAPVELVLLELNVHNQKIHNRGSYVDLFAIFWEKEDSLHGMIEYDTDLFESSTIKRFAFQFQILFESVISGSQNIVAELPILSDDEQVMILEEWNSTRKEIPKQFCLHSFFEEQATKYPERVACIFDRETITYKELNEKANKLANYLLSRGVNQGTFVGIYLERSIELVISVYAVLKAGGSYIPLDPAFPTDRLQYMVDDSQLSVLLTTSHFSSAINLDSNKKVVIDVEWDTIQQCQSSNLNLVVNVDDLAYVIYTSGSTGKPKGVQVHHQAVVNFISSMLIEPGITKSDIFLAVTTLSFDISVLELFLPLAAGAKLIIASDKSVIDGKELLHLMREWNVTMMQATPTTWRMLIEAEWEVSNSFKALCGGEPMPADLAQKLLKYVSSVWNLYGPTETTIWSTCYQITQKNTPILIGKAIANTQVYIVNNYGQPCPIGVTGELWIGGTGVSKGYLGRSDLTAEKFISDPFYPSSSGRVYRTGDLGTYLPDGNIKIFGRIDHQIKLRGYRIELGEIEEVLLNCPVVDQCAVLVKGDQEENKSLVAYFTIKEDAKSELINFRRLLCHILPDYMIPSFFISLESMPLTANGKIDKQALPEPNYKRPETWQQLTHPNNEKEETILSIWSKILMIDIVGTHDNFFDLGGNSLLSMQILKLIEDRFAISIPSVKFFQYPTISSFTNYLFPKEPQQISQLVKKVAEQRKKMLIHQKKRQQ